LPESTPIYRTNSLYFLCDFPLKTKRDHETRRTALKAHDTPCRDTRQLRRRATDSTGWWRSPVGAFVINWPLSMLPLPPRHGAGWCAVLEALQRGLIAAGFRALRPGGRLLYATCPRTALPRACGLGMSASPPQGLIIFICFIFNQFFLSDRFRTIRDSFFPPCFFCSNVAHKSCIKWDQFSKGQVVSLVIVVSSSLGRRPGGRPTPPPAAARTKPGAQVPPPSPPPGPFRLCHSDTRGNVPFRRSSIQSSFTEGAFWDFVGSPPRSPFQPRKPLAPGGDQ